MARFCPGLRLLLDPEAGCLTPLSPHHPAWYRACVLAMPSAHVHRCILGSRAHWQHQASAGSAGIPAATCYSRSQKNTDLTQQQPWSMHPCPSQLKLHNHTHDHAMSSACLPMTVLSCTQGLKVTNRPHPMHARPWTRSVTLSLPAGMSGVV